MIIYTNLVLSKNGQKSWDYSVSEGMKYIITAVPGNVLCRFLNSCGVYQ
jgi:hypothetical protein